MRFIRRFTVWCGIFFAAAQLYAHVGGHGKGALHTWQLRSGKHLHGSLHSFRDAAVIIEDKHGKLHEVPVERLSAQDKEYADARFIAIASVNSAPEQSPVVTQPEVSVPSEETLPLSVGVSILCMSLLLLAVGLRMPKARRALSVGSAIGAACAALTLVPSTSAFIRREVLSTDPARIDSSFVPFKPLVKTRWDANWFYVESNGMPSEMPAMKGITAWQQQVPIPQPYSGNNSWQVPLNPVVATKPVLLDTGLHTGAVAIGANGVPVFNPENNRGEFSEAIGELDAFGGHCGRADDYHYHIAPTHLTKVLGNKLPVAWALDGYPLYGYLEPDGSQVKGLDEHLGHLWNGDYHYHAITDKPYMIASMRGAITVQNDQVMPQPRANPVRTFLQALKGASITDMRKCDTSHYALRYSLNGKTHWVNYRWDSTKKYTFVFVKPDTARRTETYQRK